MVSNVDPSIVHKLKLRARRHHRSFQAELRAILEQAVALSVAGARAKVEEVRAMFAGRRFSDSAALIRRDRAR
ncbi:MAG: Arc family DNA-binding protein [Candidatus Rokubacteria bacterium]|nr:Arc family DNA-binding protein [Candidatus Rokubacteria bacterium]